MFSLLILAIFMLPCKVTGMAAVQNRTNPIYEEYLRQMRIKKLQLELEKQGEVTRGLDTNVTTRTTTTLTTAPWTTITTTRPAFTPATVLSTATSLQPSKSTSAVLSPKGRPDPLTRTEATSVTTSAVPLTTASMDHPVPDLSSWLVLGIQLQWWLVGAIVAVLLLLVVISINIALTAECGKTRAEEHLEEMRGLTETRCRLATLLGSTVPNGYFLSPRRQPAPSGQTGAAVETSDRPAFASQTGKRGVGPTITAQERNTVPAGPAELRLSRVNEDNTQSSVSFHQDVVQFHRGASQGGQEGDEIEMQEFSTEVIYENAM